MLSSRVLRPSAGKLATTSQRAVLPHLTSPLRPVAPTPSAFATHAVKRAPSAFNLFTKARYTAVRDELARQQKETQLPAVTSVIRAEWSKMNEKDKQPYEAESSKLKEEVASVKAEEKKNAGPARPPSPYAMFTKEKFPEVKSKNPGAKLPEITKQISEMWKSMPEAEKKQRTEDARKQQEAFKVAKEAHDQKTGQNTTPKSEAQPPKTKRSKSKTAA